MLVIKTINEGQPLGTATVYRNLHHGTADIGLMVGEKTCWGQGYGRETWQAILHDLLFVENIRKVTGGTAKPNKAMAKIMEQSGMMLEAIRRNQEIIEDKPTDILYYAKFSQ